MCRIGLKEWITRCGGSWKRRIGPGLGNGRFLVRGNSRVGEALGERKGRVALSPSDLKKTIGVIKNETTEHNNETVSKDLKRGTVKCYTNKAMCC